MDCVDFDISIEDGYDDITVEFREKSDDGRSGFSCGFASTSSDGETSNVSVSALRAPSDGQFDLSISTKQSAFETTVTVNGALTYSDKEYSLSLEPFSFGDGSDNEEELETFGELFVTATSSEPMKT